jgi:hypothetical protein
MKTLQEILSSQALEPYLKKANELKALNDLWSILMCEWAPYCKIANFEQGILILQVKNSAWATRVYYAAPELYKKLADFPEFSELKKIKCLIMSNTSD